MALNLGQPNFYCSQFSIVQHFAVKIQYSHTPFWTKHCTLQGITNTFVIQFLLPQKSNIDVMQGSCINLFSAGLDGIAEKIISPGRWK